MKFQTGDIVWCRVKPIFVEEMGKCWRVNCALSTPLLSINTLYSITSDKGEMAEAWEDQLEPLEPVLASIHSLTTFK